MLNWILTLTQGLTTPKFTETFLQSKDGMMNDVLLEYLDGYLTWDELCEEAQFIEAMFEEE